MAFSGKNLPDEYITFFDNFIAKYDPTDQLPVNVAHYTVTKEEVLGSVVDWVIQYLRIWSCPKTLISPFARTILDEIKDDILDVENCKFYEEEYGGYNPLPLMQYVVKKIQDICTHYRDNDKLFSYPNHVNHTSVFCSKNRRRYMEDCHVVIHDLQTIFDIKDSGPVSYYAVFDGHNGTGAARYSSCHLHQNIAESCYYPFHPEQAMIDAFTKTDRRMSEKTEEFRLTKSGTTAVCVLLHHRDKMLHVAWVGDSEAFLVKEGKPIPLVNPHRASREDEKARIENAGGLVIFWQSIWRVNGQLSVSRAIGDGDQKPSVISVPEVKSLDLDGEEDFLILACDGLWDQVTPEEATREVYRQLLCSSDKDYKYTAALLGRLAKENKSEDNITIIVVFLKDPALIKLDGVDMETATAESFARRQNGKYGEFGCSDEDDEDFGPETNVDEVKEKYFANFDFSENMPATKAEIEKGAASESLDNGKAVLSDESEEDEWDYIKGDQKKQNSGKPQELEMAKKLPDDDHPLNPNAAEFVPVSPTFGMTGSSPPHSPLEHPPHPEAHDRLLNDVFIASSPKKGQERSLEDVEVPSLDDFEHEIMKRPSDVNECEMTDDPEKNKNATFESCDFNNLTNDTSTRAVFGDDSSCARYIEEADDLAKRHESNEFEDTAETDIAEDNQNESLHNGIYDNEDFPSIIEKVPKVNDSIETQKKAEVDDEKAAESEESEEEISDVHHAGVTKEEFTNDADLHSDLENEACKIEAHSVDDKITPMGDHSSSASFDFLTHDIVGTSVSKLESPVDDFLTEKRMIEIVEAEFENNDYNQYENNVSNPFSYQKDQPFVGEAEKEVDYRKEIYEQEDTAPREENSFTTMILESSSTQLATELNAANSDFKFEDDVVNHNGFTESLPDETSSIESDRVESEQAFYKEEEHFKTVDAVERNLESATAHDIEISDKESNDIPESDRCSLKEVGKLPDEIQTNIDDLDEFELHKSGSEADVDMIQVKELDHGLNHLDTDVKTLSVGTDIDSDVEPVHKQGGSTSYKTLDIAHDVPVTEKSFDVSSFIETQSTIYGNENVLETIKHDMQESDKTTESEKLEYELRKSVETEKLECELQRSHMSIESEKLESELRETKDPFKLVEPELAYVQLSQPQEFESMMFCAINTPKSPVVEETITETPENEILCTEKAVEVADVIEEKLTEELEKISEEVTEAEQLSEEVTSTPPPTPAMNTQTDDREKLAEAMGKLVDEEEKLKPDTALTVAGAAAVVAAVGVAATVAAVADTPAVKNEVKKTAIKKADDKKSPATKPLTKTAPKPRTPTTLSSKTNVLPKKPIAAKTSPSKPLAPVASARSIAPKPAPKPVPSTVKSPKDKPAVTATAKPKAPTSTRTPPTALKPKVPNGDAAKPALVRKAPAAALKKPTLPSPTKAPVTLAARTSLAPPPRRPATASKAAPPTPPTEQTKPPPIRRPTSAPVKPPVKAPLKTPPTKPRPVPKVESRVNSGLKTKDGAAKKAAVCADTNQTKTASEVRQNGDA